MFYQSALVVTAKNQVCIFDKKKGFQCLDVSIEQWKSEAVVVAVAKIAKKKRWSSVSLVLSDDFCYNLVLLYPEDGLLTAEYVQKELAKLLPEKINHLLWDYEVVKVSDEKRLVQVLAVSRSQLLSLDGLVNKAKLPVQSIRSFGYAIAKLVKDKKPVLVISRLDKLLIGTLVCSQAVIYSKVLNEETFSSEVKYLLGLCKQYELPEVGLIIVNSDSELPKLNNLDKKIKVKSMKIEVASSPIFRQKIKEEDASSLGFEINEVANFMAITKKKELEDIEDDSEFDQKQVVINQPKPSLVKKISKKQIKNFVILIALLIPLIGVSLLAYQQLKPKNIELPHEEKQINEVGVVSTPSPIPTEEPVENLSSEFNPKVYKIHILNGSGKSGEAAKLAEILLAQNFEDIEVGNTDSSYLETEISALDEVLFDNLKEIIQTYYSVSSSSAKLEETSLFDAEIIIGKELSE
jgi:hypothetical protein